MKRPLPHAQQGIALLIGMIMLLLITLLAMSAFNIGTSGLQTVGNMQQRNQVLGAAQNVVEQTLSSTLFFNTPSNVFINPCVTPNTQCLDINGDGTNDINVVITPNPTCIKVQTIKNYALNLSNDEDLGCSVGSQQNFGVAGAASGDSLCANSLWEINAVATDSITEARASVTQGVAVRVSTDNIAASCP